MNTIVSYQILSHTKIVMKQSKKDTRPFLTGRDLVRTPFSGQCCRVGSKQIDNVANVNSQNNKFAPCSLA